MERFTEEEKELLILKGFVEYEEGLYKYFVGFDEKYISSQIIDGERCFRMEWYSHDYDGLSDFSKFYSTPNQTLEEFILERHG